MIIFLMASKTYVDRASDFCRYVERYEICDDLGINIGLQEVKHTFGLFFIGSSLG